MTAVFGDLISQLQDCNAELCSHFFNFTGAIQRDATPASVGEEPAEAPQPPAAGPDTIAQVPELAAQVHMRIFLMLPLEMRHDVLSAVGSLSH